MPTIGPIVDSPGTNWSSYSSKFTHAKESAEEACYSVVLDSGIQVDLTVTARTGSGRFAFLASTGNTILINAGGSARGNRDGGDGSRHRCFESGNRISYQRQLRRQFHLYGLLCGRIR